MSSTAPHVGIDPDRTRADETGPVTWREVGTLSRGSVLAGKYRLEMLLGQGGMAFVWSAYNLELELPVALKLLRTGAKDERLAERLRLEARAAARLVHPSIVRVFDIGVAESGEPFIVMELLTGESLAEVLARGPLSGTRAVQLLLPIAEALALSHTKGIVHRDLKPDNVFLATEGEQLQPKLLDFGIAKLAHASPALDKLTGKGIALGSPHYMSPEQVGGDDVDYRSDIWSFCVMLYKAVTGSFPFVGADRRAIMDAILENQPARLATGAGIDTQLARLIHWGLTKDPTQRPTSMRELGRQLAQWLLTQGISDDASGAPLAAKWLAHVAEPSMRRPPPLTETFSPPPPPATPAATPPPPPAATASVTSSTPALADTTTAPAERSKRPAPARRAWVMPPARRRKLALAALMLMIAGATGAWIGSARSATYSSIAAPPARVAHPPLRTVAAAPVMLAAAQAQAQAPSESSALSAQQLTDTEASLQEPATESAGDRAPRAPITKPKTSPVRARPTQAQLPF
jgi:eukaryotic-like serine/threonine-protein kinase